MNIHDFSVIKVHLKGRSLFFTGLHHKHRFSRLRRMFGLLEVSPVFTDNKRDAEFHISPAETYEAVTRLRMQFPQYNWYYDIVSLPDYTNEAMMPSFCVIVKHKDSNRWMYYANGAFEHNGTLCTSHYLDGAKFLNIDDVNIVCKALHINYKDYTYMTIRRPKMGVTSEVLEEYVKMNPEPPFFMVFNLRDK